MRGYVTRRVLALPLIVIAVYTLVFFLARSSPGGPWDPNLPVPQAVIDNLRAHYHADEPLIIQYWELAKNIVLEGDLGPSYLAMRRDVSTMIAEALPISLALGAASVGLALVVGIALGVLAAMRRNTSVDYASMGLVMFGISVPPYVITPVLVLVFAIWLPWLPSQGWSGLFSKAAIIPVIALALGPAATVARYARNSVLDVIRLDYVRTAEAKGLPPRLVITRHVLRNALIPIITVAGLYITRTLTHTFYVEYIYGIPGMGRLGVDAVFGRDYPVILGVSLVVAILVAVTNLLVDLTYAWADPRVRLR
jgi:ABC-type dipeptide/oligopeptide/nickel transport system permease component